MRWNVQQKECAGAVVINLISNYYNSSEVIRGMSSEGVSSCSVLRSLRLFRLIFKSVWYKLCEWRLMRRLTFLSSQLDILSLFTLYLMKELKNLEAEVFTENSWWRIYPLLIESDDFPHDGGCPVLWFWHPHTLQKLYIYYQVYSSDFSSQHLITLNIRQLLKG